MTFLEIRRLYPTDPIEYHFLCQLDASKNLGQEKLERAREVEVAQHLIPAKGASPTRQRSDQWLKGAGEICSGTVLVCCLVLGAVVA